MGKFLLVGSGILGFGIQNTAKGFRNTNNDWGGGGKGGTPLYKLYRYVPPHRAGFMGRFGLKTGIHFAHSGLESGYRFNSK